MICYHKGRPPKLVVGREKRNNVSDVPQTEVRDFEPSMALTDGKNGLQFYYRLISLIPDILKSGGGIMLEVGFNQAQKVAREMKNAGIEQLQIANDLQGIPRVVSGIWTGLASTLIHLN